MDNFRDSYFKVSWDLTAYSLKGIYWGKQYDTGRGFVVTVINGDQVVTATNEVLRLKWEKLDSTTGYVNATIVNGKFIIENIDQMFTVRGSVRADFELSVGGKFVASTTFHVNVEKAVAVDSIESSSEFTALHSALLDVGTVQDSLDGYVDAESVRAANESIRIDNESDREAAEGLRVSAETDREAALHSALLDVGTVQDSLDGYVDAESVRAANESIRIDNESDREAAEGLRVSAETDREAALHSALLDVGTVQDSLDGYVDAESVRAANESIRIDNESDREAAEGLRVSAETDREAALHSALLDVGTVQDSLDGYVDAESVRAANESIRIDNESDREAAEGLRVSAETDREAALHSALLDVGTVQDSLDGYVDAESVRAANESIRIDNESDREAAEGLRVSAETDREAAEALRQTGYATMDEAIALKADLSEIESARGTEPTLGARLDSTDAQLNNVTQDFTQHKLNYVELEREVTELSYITQRYTIESWQKVQELVRAGLADKAFKVGDQFVANYNNIPTVFDVIAINHDIPTNKNFINSLTIQTHDCIMNAQFDAAEALYYAEEELLAGEHVFIQDDNSKYKFITTQAIPAGGQVYVTSWGEPYVPLKITTYAANRTTVIESGIDVISTADSDTLGVVNVRGRCRYGSNNYVESTIREWLNSDEELYEWTPQTKYDRPSIGAPYSGSGFLKLLDPELAAVIGEVDKQVARNTVTDGGGQDLFSDKVFLLSRVETGYGTERVTTGEVVYPYYEGLSEAGKIKLLSNTPRTWWLRSPHVGNSYSLRLVLPSGALYTSNADNAYGLSPACVII